MVNRNRRTSIATAAFALIVVILFAAGGLYVRSLIGKTFTLSNRLSDTRALAYTALRDQLDEETGLRGFAGNPRARLLQPYNRARPVIEGTLRQLDAAIPGLGIPQAQPLADDLLAVNALYRKDVIPRLTDASETPQRVWRKRNCSAKPASIVFAPTSG